MTTATLVEDSTRIYTRHLAQPWLTRPERTLVECTGGALHLTCHDDPARVRIESRWGEPCGEVLLAVQDCHYGGVRPWFLCPGCGKQRLVLAVHDGRALCRRCHGLQYSSTRLRTWERHAEERERLEAWLADPPKGTWRSRYEKVLERYYAIGRGRR